MVMEDPSGDQVVDMDLLHDAPPALRLFAFEPPEASEMKFAHSTWTRLRRLLRSSGGATEASAPVGTSPNTVATRRAGKADSSIRREVIDLLNARQFQRSADVAHQLARSVAIARRPDLVISSGPPHYTHIAAARIATELGVPLALDLRDPWVEYESDGPRDRGLAWLRSMRSAERRCLDAADLVVLNTDAARAMYQARYPQSSAKFITIMNGADPEIGGQSAKDRFVIAYVGERYGLRSPANLFAAVRRVIDDLRISVDELSIEFMGPEGDIGPSSQMLAEQAGVGAYFHSLGRQPRRESLALQARASVLVLLPQAQFWAIPAKVFEHVQFDAWILALASQTSAVAALLLGSAGAVLDPDDVSAIASQLRTWILAYRAGQRPQRINGDGRFNRTRQAALLFEALDATLERRSRSVLPPADHKAAIRS